MRDRRTYTRRIIICEAAGFLAILAVVFLDEIFGLPEQYLGAEGGHPEWKEFTVEALVVLAVAATVILMTRRLVKRLFYLENFLRVCAWCRKINHDDEWISLEEYLSSGFDTRTTHGMCPECFEKSKRESA